MENRIKTLEKKETSQYIEKKLHRDDEYESSSKISSLSTAIIIGVSIFILGFICFDYIHLNKKIKTKLDSIENINTNFQKEVKKTMPIIDKAIYNKKNELKIMEDDRLSETLD